MRDTLARPEGKPQTRLQFDENHGPIFKFLAHDPFGRKTKAISIEV
jgi:hypothetical protein